mmetsp:Transcript_4973/g.12207  ORF Transcript_4973/g.12207 Transcript_4973/m.12207 type:complete len:372 (-) Transcript_4973:180-1295(-)
MANDMFARLADLLNAVEDGQIKEEEPKKKKLKRKKLKKKKKAGDQSDAERSRSPSPHKLSSAGAAGPATTAFQSPSARRPYSAHVGSLHTTSMSWPTGLNGARYHAGAPMSAGPHRPPSPSMHPQASSSQTASHAHMRPGAALRPHSAGPGLTTSQGTMYQIHHALPGPTISEKTAPKYTANSIKTPELGTIPGSYQAPPWRPNVSQDVDPMRRELAAPINEKRFKHVLAVPAHVLAQSLYHPDAPSAQARVKQLQDDLRTARMDRKLVYNEKVQLEGALKVALERGGWAEHEAEALRFENEALREQLAAVHKAQKALKYERDQLEEQVKALKSASRDAEVASLHHQLSAANVQIEDLRFELKRALQLAAS